MSNDLKKIGLLLNSQAKKSQRYPKLVKKMIEAFPQPSHVWRPQNLHELSLVTRKILDEQFDYVFIFGGDGTFRVAVESFLNHQSEKDLPIFIVLQGGTGNLYSMNFYGRRHPLRFMQKVLQKINLEEKIPTRRLNVLKINQTYGFIFAIGGIANFVEYYLNYKKRSITLGLWISIKILISFLAGSALYQKLFPAINLDIIKDGQEKMELKCTGISCAAIDGYLLRPYLDIETNQKFSVLTFHRSPIALFRWIPAMLAKKKFSSRHIEQSNAQTIEIISPHPLQPMVDGDMLSKTSHIKIELGPEIKILDMKS